MNKLVIDAANEKIFLMIITKDDIYNITKENTKINFEKLTLIVVDFLYSNSLKLDDIQMIKVSYQLCIIVSMSQNILQQIFKWIFL